MKVSKLQKFAWVFFALALGTTTLFAALDITTGQVKAGHNIRYNDNPITKNLPDPFFVPLFSELIFLR